MRITTSLGLATAMALLAIPAGRQVQAGTVTSIAGYSTNPTPGQWYNSDSRVGANGSSTAITTAPSNSTNTPPPETANGVASLVTDPTNTNSIAQIGVQNTYGTVSSILNTLSLSYSYFKSDTGSTNNSAAPSLKLTFENASTNESVTLIYEPYWQSAHGGTVSTNTWFTDTINENSGLFWSHGGFGSTNSAGGTPGTLHTLKDWADNYLTTGNFSGASLTTVSFGVGTYNLGQIDYFDAVSINGTALGDVTYDFQVAPEPSTLVSACIAGLMFGGISWRRRKAARVSA